MCHHQYFLWRKIYTWAVYWNAIRTEIFPASHVRSQTFVSADKTSLRNKIKHSQTREKTELSGLNNDIQWTQQMFAREGDLKKKQILIPAAFFFLNMAHSYRCFNDCVLILWAFTHPYVILTLQKNTKKFFDKHSLCRINLKSSS